MVQSDGCSQDADSVCCVLALCRAEIKCRPKCITISGKFYVFCAGGCLQGRYGY